MSRHIVRLVIVLIVGLVPTVASAQHEGHQMPGTLAPSAELTQCLRVQPVIENVITAAMARAEAARLSNSPADLRAAVDQLEGALRDIRAQSAPCVAAATSADPHAGHTMPATPPATKPTPASKPAAATPAASHSADPHAGHSAQSGDQQKDPVNGLMVDPATAPKTTYKGQTYYFSSEKTRKEFLENPAKFAKK